MPKPTNPQGVASLKLIEAMARMMDSQFRFPGTNFRFGLDPVIGLIPFAGDAASLAIQAFLMIIMIRHGASRKVIILMTLNLLFDFVLGSIPVLGGIGDFFYKSSERNLQLLKAHYGEGKYHGSGTGIIVIILLVTVCFIVGVSYLTYIFLRWLIHLF